MGALARMFFNERQKAAAAKQPETKSTADPTRAAGMAFGSVDDPDKFKPAPGFNPKPWQVAERA